MALRRCGAGAHVVGEGLDAFFNAAVFGGVLLDFHFFAFLSGVGEVLLQRYFGAVDLAGWVDVYFLVYPFRIIGTVHREDERLLPVVQPEHVLQLIEPVFVFGLVQQDLAVGVVNNRLLVGAFRLYVGKTPRGIHLRNPRLPSNEYAEQRRNAEIHDHALVHRLISVVAPYREFHVRRGDPGEIGRNGKECLSGMDIAG